MREGSGYTSYGYGYGYGAGPGAAGSGTPYDSDRQVSTRARTLTGHVQGERLTSCWGTPRHDTPGVPVQAPNPVALAT